MTWLQGKKTYLVAGGMFGYAVLGYGLGRTPALDVQIILEALGLAALRAGVAKT